MSGSARELIDLPSWELRQAPRPDSSECSFLFIEANALRHLTNYCWIGLRRFHAGDDKSNSTFDPAVFLAHAGLGRRIVELKQVRPFSPREMRQTRSSIFRMAGQGSPWFHRVAKKPPSRCYRLGRLCWRGRAGDCPRAAPVYRHRNQQLHCAQDQQRRDDSRHA